MKICQSCGMPMDKTEMFGKDKEGKPCDEYCVYCYPNGEFNNPNETLEEMINTCIPFMVEEGFSEEKAREMLQERLPKLKRWAKA